MKLSARRLATLGLLASSLPLVTTNAPAEGSSSTITVHVSVLKNRKGSLGCRLYASGQGFPEATAGTVEKIVPIAGKLADCSFEGVGPGTYAVALMHDENDNRVLDKNLLGIPVEGYGVSNNHTHALSSPTWEESRFVVEAGKDRSLDVKLRY